MPTMKIQDILIVSGVLVLLFVVVLGCGLILWWFSQSSPPVETNSSETISEPVDMTVAPIEDPWDRITKVEAETVCLSEAKQYAEKEGYSEALVFDCTCGGEESDEVKTYACEINAIDGTHGVSILCVKTENRCTITTEQGAETYSFEQLEALLEESDLS